MRLEEYAEELNQEVLASAEVDGISRLDAFTQLVIERLTAAGEFDDGELSYYRKTGLEVSGWSASGEEDVLHVFVTDWRDETPPPSLTRTQAAALLRRLTTFVSRSVDGLATQLEESSPVWELADMIERQVKSLQEIRVYVFSDASTKTIELPKLDPIAGVPVTPHLWDLDRLYRLDTSGLEREVITADITEFLGGPLPCLAGPQVTDQAVYLAVVPAQLIAKLYARYGSRLLERNVRSFLQARGAVNRGIRETLLKAPERFLAYNNGLSATAANVTLVKTNAGGLAISAIRDLQIVNGGQTTASIHHVASKDKADLSKVAVQLKLTVVDADLIDEIVPSISMYSNTQNKVTGADFSANHPFHVRVEELSRTVWAPAPDGGQRQTHWFYERARGQYNDESSRAGTPAKQRQFKLINPLGQKFNKVELAKYVNSWEMRPHTVSLGGEKNFREFMIHLGNNPVPLDVPWFQRLIGMTILFRSADKIVLRQQFGGYKSQIVTYSIAKLAHETQSRVDLEAIWRAQKLSPAVSDAIADISQLVYGVIVNPTGSVRHIGEWAKKLDCWKRVEELNWKPSAALKKELRTQPGSVSKPQRNSSKGPASKEADVIQWVVNVPAEHWSAIGSWATETENLLWWQRNTAFRLGRIVSLGRKPTLKQAQRGKALYEEAVEDLGFQFP
ncbi:MAG: AIPR family protein [Candidatus Nanopelagicales bacterium]